jgi:hypothetical protein
VIARYKSPSRNLTLFGIGLSGILLMVSVLGYVSIFWIFVGLTFIVMHLTWVFQLLRGAKWREIDWSSAKIVLVAFAICGNIGWVILNR